MRRRLAPILTALACGLALAACGRSQTSPVNGGEVENVDALVKTLNTFTDELLSKVEKAQDTKAGLLDAQVLLDERKTGLAASIARLRHDAGAKGRLLEAEVDNTDRVHRLQLKYADAAAKDAELKARLGWFIDTYDAMFR